MNNTIASRKTLLILIAANALVFWLYTKTVSGGLDFQAFYFAGKTIIRAPAHLYDLDYQRRIQKVVSDHDFAPYFHPPHEVLLFLPFSVLPYTVSVNAWRAFMLLCLVAAGGMLGKAAGMNATTIALLTLAMSPVGMSLFVGQDSFLLLLLLCACFYLLREDRDVAAAFVLSMALFKPQLPVILALAVLATGRQKFFAWFVGVSAALTGASIAFVGRTGIQQILQAEKLGEQGLGVAAMPTVRGLLAVAAGDHFWIAVAILAVALLTMFTVWRRSPSLEFAIGSAICLGSAFTPYIYAYDLVVLAIPLALIAQNPKKHDGLIGALLTSAMLLQLLYFLKASSLLAIPTLALGIMTFRLRVSEQARLPLGQAATSSGPTGAP